MQNHRAPPSPESTSSSRGALRNAGFNAALPARSRGPCAKDARASFSFFCERPFDEVDWCPATGDTREAAILLRAASKAKPAAVMEAKDHPLYRAAIADYEGSCQDILQRGGQSELLHTKIRRENTPMWTLPRWTILTVFSSKQEKCRGTRRSLCFYRESLKRDVHAEESVVKRYPWVVWPALENPDLPVCAEATDEDLLRMERRKAQRAAKAVHLRLLLESWEDRCVACVRCWI